MNLVLLKNVSLVGVHWGAYSSTYPKIPLKESQSNLQSEKKQSS